MRMRASAAAAGAAAPLAAAPRRKPRDGGTQPSRRRRGTKRARSPSPAGGALECAGALEGVVAALASDIISAGQAQPIVTAARERHAAATLSQLGGSPIAAPAAVAAGPFARDCLSDSEEDAVGLLGGASAQCDRDVLSDSDELQAVPSAGGPPAGTPAAVLPWSEAQDKAIMATMRSAPRRTAAALSAAAAAPGSALAGRSGEEAMARYKFLYAQVAAALTQQRQQ
jgi:hypothetical protein